MCRFVTRTVIENLLMYVANVSTAYKIIEHVKLVKYRAAHTRKYLPSVFRKKIFLSTVGKPVVLQLILFKKQTILLIQLLSFKCLESTMNVTEFKDHLKFRKRITIHMCAKKCMNNAYV